MGLTAIHSWKHALPAIVLASATAACRDGPAALLRREASTLDAHLWADMRKRLAHSPGVLVRPNRRCVLAQIAGDMGGLYAGCRWSVRCEPLTAVLEGWQGVRLVDRSGRATGRVMVRLGRDAISQLQHTVEASFQDHCRCARGTTWCDFGEALRIKVPGASFAANLLPAKGYPNALRYCMENVEVQMGAEAPRDETTTEMRLAQMAARFNRLFGDVDVRRCVPPRAGELGLEVTWNPGERTATASWSALGALADYWVRLDVDAGELSIVSDKPNMVTVKSVPNDRHVSVDCYAISPDATRWVRVSRTVR